MLKLLFALCCIAGTILIQKFVLLSQVPILILVSLRTLLPGSLLLSYNLIRNHQNPWPISRIFTLNFFALTCTTTLLPLMLKNMAHQQMSSAKFALLGSTDPFITAVLVFIIFGQTINRWQLAGILVASCGTAILALQKVGIDAQSSIFLLFTWPELLAIIAIVLGRLGWMASQNLLKQQLFTPTETNIMFMFLPGIFAGLFTVMSGEQSWLWSNTHSWQLWLAIGASISLNSIGCIVLTQTLQTFSALTIALAGTSIIPVIVAICSYFLYHEPITYYFVLAAILILVGIGLFNWRQPKK